MQFKTPYAAAINAGWVARATKALPKFAGPKEDDLRLASMLL